MSALARKTVILVTHQVEFLSEVDHILVIRIAFHHISYHSQFRSCTALVVFSVLTCYLTQNIIHLHPWRLCKMEMLLNQEVIENY